MRQIFRTSNSLRELAGRARVHRLIYSEALYDAASEIDQLSSSNAGWEKITAEQFARIERLLAALSELHAMVWGECSSLLNEDSGGSAKLDLEIRELLNHQQQAIQKYGCDTCRDDPEACAETPMRHCAKLQHD